MIKKIICMLLLAFNLICNIALADDVKIIINGNEIQTDSPAVIISGTTMVPFRVVLNELGITNEQILWDDASSSLEVITNDNYIFMAIGNKGAIVNGIMKELLVAPYISEENRTMIPLRFITESLGAEVKWDEETTTIHINKEVV